MEPQSKTNEQIKDAPEYFNPSQKRNLEIMTMTDDKTLHRDTMVFPFRWFNTLDKLNDTELRQMFLAIGEYAKSKKKPDFTGTMNALWQEFQQRMDTDFEKYIRTCKKNQENIRKRWDTTVYDCIRPHTKNTDADPDPDPDIKERTINSSKETAEPFSLTSDKSKTVPYTKWTPEQFKAEVAKYPEYAEIADDFTAYWTEPTPKGKMLFQTQKAWDTKRRLARWRQNQSHTPDTEELNNEMTIDKQIERMQLF